MTVQPNTTPLAAAIRRLRGTRTQQAFAELLDVRRATVIAWESGTVPNAGTAHRLVAMGLDVDLWLDATRPGPTTQVAS